MSRIHRRHIIIFVLLGALAFMLLFQKTNELYESHKVPATLGMSFSPRYATYLGLNPRKTYLNILEQLQIKKIRIPVYWDQIEPEDGKYDFSELDFYVNEAQKHHTQVILAVGYKVPRWPECYLPSWIKADPDRFPAIQLRQMIKATIEHYDNNPAVLAWQIENEPLFPFGECLPRTENDFIGELKYAKTLTKKPIIITDTGEYSSWVTAMQNSDIFGTTLYRDANFPPFGHFYFPLQPWYYRIRSELVRKFLAPHNYKTIVVELQGEAWTTKGVLETPLDQQLKVFPPKQIIDNVKYAQRAGLDEIYLWGAEWYYYMADQGHPEYLQAISSISRN